jgi:hypothetical protein
MSTTATDDYLSSTSFLGLSYYMISGHKKTNLSYINFSRILEQSDIVVLVYYWYGILWKCATEAMYLTVLKKL